MDTVADFLPRESFITTGEDLAQLDGENTVR